MPATATKSKASTAVKPIGDKILIQRDEAETQLWTGQADLEPWLAFFLGALEKHRDKLQAMLELERRAMEFSPLQQKILETAKIHVTTRGGDARNIIDVIRSGDWTQYFTDDAPLSTAAPLSNGRSTRAARLIEPRRQAP